MISHVYKIIIFCSPIFQWHYLILTMKYAVLRPFMENVKFVKQWRVSEYIIFLLKCISNLGYHKINRMAKKIIKKNKPKRVVRAPRMTNARLTILQGEAYLRSFLRKQKATRTMRDIAGLNPTPKKINKPLKKASSRPVRPAIKAVPASKKNTKKPVTSKKQKVTKSKSIPISAPVIAPLRTGSRLSNQSNKITKFKKNDRDDLQIPAFGFIDVCFCLDTTGSMCSEIEQTKHVIQSIIHNIQNKVRTQGLQMRFAIVAYRDHPPQDHSYVTQIQDFTDQFQAIKYVKQLSAGGGGDFPEAVHDGLYDSATKLNWAEVPGTPVLRYIFHIADAPPHGKQFLNSGEKLGCLCGRQTDDVVNEVNKRQIHYRLIKTRPNPALDKMGEIFKSKMMDYGDTVLANASEMNVKVSEMIICEVLPDFA